MRPAAGGVKMGGMTEPESDLELVGRIYREQMTATKHFDPAYQACLAAWRERHPEAGEQAAKEMVAGLISAAIAAGLTVRW
jgi:hypothetical protein